MTTLVFSDPLANQEVLITIALPQSDAPRDERPLLLSIGVEGKVPVVQTGLYANIATIIEQTWTAFGVANPEPAAEALPVAEEVIATEAPQLPRPQKPQPQAVNLSLF